MAYIVMALTASVISVPATSMAVVGADGGITFFYLGIADGMSSARVWARRYSK